MSYALTGLGRHGGGGGGGHHGGGGRHGGFRGRGFRGGRGWGWGGGYWPGYWPDYYDAAYLPVEITVDTCTPEFKAGRVQVPQYLNGRPVVVRWTCGGRIISGP